MRAHNVIYISTILFGQSHKLRRLTPFRASHTHPCLSLRVSPEAKNLLVS